MIVLVKQCGIRLWGLWSPMPLDDAISFYEDEPVMVETMEEADFLRGYALVMGKELKDLSVFSPIKDGGIYRSHTGYQIKIQIKLELNQ